LNNRQNILANNNTSLAIFLRYPHPGKVKSRLATSLGQEKAANFYRLCTEQLFGEIERVSHDFKKYIFYSDKSDENDIRQWAGPGFSYLPQAEGNLGKRLEQAFSGLFGKGMDKVIILASDTPDITYGIINDSIEALDRHDIVIGPSFDGGYYLLGMKKQYGELFRGILWSTEKVLGQTMSNIEALKLDVYNLIELRDIDTEEDLRKWVNTASDRSNPALVYAETVMLV
jgi:rSAM/selenodomain-associated transferase 1